MRYERGGPFGQRMGFSGGRRRALGWLFVLVIVGSFLSAAEVQPVAADSAPAPESIQLDPSESKPAAIDDPTLPRTAPPNSGAVVVASSAHPAPGSSVPAEPALGLQSGLGAAVPRDVPNLSIYEDPQDVPYGTEPSETLTPAPRPDLIRPGPAVPFESAPAAPSPEPTTSFLATEYTGWNPPDTDGAVGPNHLVIAVNGAFVVQNRSGTVLLSETLGDFWTGYWDAGNSCETPFDPRVLYDAQVDRWILVSVGGRSTCVDKSVMLVAVSDSGDPTGTWYRTAFKADATDTVWADYPTLGFSQNHIVVGANMFHSDNTYERPRVWALERPVSATSPKWVWNGLDPTKYAFTLMPATTLDPGVSTTYLASHWVPSSGTTALYELTGALGSPPTISDGPIAYPQAAPWSQNAPSANFAPQLGVVDKINNGDARIQGLVLRNGELWATHHVFLPAGAPNRTSIQWWNLQTDGTVLQQGLIDDPSGTIFRAYPSISVNTNNDVLIGYSSFSAGQYASASYSLRRASDPPGTFGDSALLKAGEGPYVLPSSSRNRWGDYSSTHVDPVDDTQFWTIQEFARPPVSGVGRWATWWGQIDPGTVAPPNDALADAVVLSVDAGSVNGTNTGATGEVGEESGTCRPDTQINSVWWAWMPTASGSVQIDTNGSDFDTTLAVYTGSTIPGLFEVGCDDDSGEGLRSLVTMSVVAGTTYQIRVDGYNTSTGAIVLNHDLDSDDAVAPEVSVSAPSNWSTVESPVSIEGSATDDVGVTSVVLEVFDRDTSLWWNGASWQAGRTTVPATLDAPGTTSTGWSYSFAPPTAASEPYWVTVRSFDAASNPSAYAYTNFTVAGDVSPPGASVASPVNWSTVTSPVSIEGSATDDVGVTDVVLEIWDRDTTEWWNGTGWQVGRTAVAASLDDAGATATGWSYSFAPPTAASEPYWVTVRSFDAASNPSEYAYTNFTIEGDVTAPEVLVPAPVNWSTVTSPVSIEGSATDDVGVTDVLLEIWDRDTSEWWNGTGWQVARTSFAASLDDAGATATGWSYSFAPPTAASEPYWVTVRSFDAASNASAYVHTNFTIEGDVTPPEVLVSAPSNWSTVFGPIVDVEGTATDNDTVDVVRLEIYDRVTTEWWNGSGWQVGRTTVDASLVGADWSYEFSPDGPYSAQPYWVTVRGFDVSGNVSPYVYTNFTIE